MKTLTLAFLLVFTSHIVPAQNLKASKNVYGEILGPGILSVNYDTRFTKKNNGLGMRIGFGYVPNFDESGLSGAGAYSIPAGLNYLIGKRKNFLELGAGASYFFEAGPKDDIELSSFFLGYIWIGYKYQPLTNGFTFRAGLCPAYDADEFIPYYFGVSFGYAFK
jgi:hypothetical protein